MDILAVFKMRSDAIKVARALKNKRIVCTTISTPSYLRLGCGLSVLFPRGWESTVREIITSVAADSFYGFFTRK